MKIYFLLSCFILISPKFSAFIKFEVELHLHGGQTLCTILSQLNPDHTCTQQFLTFVLILSYHLYLDLASNSIRWIRNLSTPPPPPNCKSVFPFLSPSWIIQKGKILSRKGKFEIFLSYPRFLHQNSESVFLLHTSCVQHLKFSEFYYSVNMRMCL